MPQKEYHPTGEQIAAEAWKRFEEWCRKYDPEGNMDTLDLANAYDLANGLATTNGNQGDAA